MLRLRRGAVVTVADGLGGWRACTLGPAGTLEPTGAVRHVPQASPVITVAFAVTKGERPELVVQKLTELGVDRISPFHARRSVVRWEGDRAVRHLERLRRVAREASAQSRRAWLPVVTDMVELGELLDTQGTALADPGGDAPSLAAPTVVIGPEGGFTAEEKAMAGRTMALGSLVLRAETAAIAAGALLTNLREGLVVGR